jgi:formylglycine-generating enzyme required for sulfatase activity
MHQPTPRESRRQSNSKAFRTCASLFAAAIVLLVTLGCEKPADQPDTGAQPEPNESAATVATNDATTMADPNNANEPAQPETAAPKPPAVTEQDVAPLRNRAEAMWDRVRRIDPGQSMGERLSDANALVQSARSLVRASRWSEARDAYRRAIEPLQTIENLNSVRLGALSERQSLRTMQVNARKIGADLSQATTTPAAKKAFQDGKFEKAAELWQQARADVLVSMAETYQRKGNWHAAKRALTVVSLIDPDNAAAKRLKGRTGRIKVYKKWPFDAAEARSRQKETAKALGLASTTLTLKLGSGASMKLALIPPGRFRMGSPLNERGRVVDDEGPQRMVTITRPFWIGMHEVTVEQFAAFVKDTGYKTTAEKEGWAYVGRTQKWKRTDGASWRKHGFPQEPNHPVVCVSHHDAVAFCRWLSKRTKSKIVLPTEARWEYACRAGSAERFSYGLDERNDQLAQYGWYQANSGWRTHPVGLKKPNSWGLYDFHGNVWEWCADYYQDSYTGLAAKDPTGPENGSMRCTRGGGWSNRHRACRSSDRWRYEPDTRSCYTGFRVTRGI